MKASIHWGRFIWDTDKERTNEAQHGIDFRTAAKVFLDPGCLIVTDRKHSGQETRWFCIGRVDSGILTVRFTYRGRQVRIIGAGYWRKERKLYEKTKNV